MLPEPQTPTYSIELPVSKKKLRFRPYLVREQKILILAAESDNPEDLTNVITQILNACALDPIDIFSLSHVDVEFYFYNLRARSIAETASPRYRCNAIKEDGTKCSAIMEKEINLLEDLKFLNLENNGIVKIYGDYYIKFKPPLFKFNTLNKNPSELDLFDNIYNNIECIFTDDNVYPASDFSVSDIETIINRLTIPQLKEVEKYFNNLPIIIKEFDIVCPKCGYEHKIVSEDIFDFLD